MTTSETSSATSTPSASVEMISPEPPTWDRRTVMRQRWDELAYFHWSYEPDVVQRLLPDGLIVDTFDDRAWVGLIPFEMRNVQLGPTPPVPFLGSFIEINVRTYVPRPARPPLRVVLLARRAAFGDRRGRTNGVLAPVLLGEHRAHRRRRTSP
ncbi:MAG: DUF2071 domain-containing protein, partial [Ilumatobacter fluminis]